MHRTATTVVLARRPVGRPRPADFAFRALPLAPLAEGEVLVRNEWMSVDPYMRRRMNVGKSYVAPFLLGEPMDGGAVGRVVESASPGLAEGDMVLHHLGWRDLAVLPSAAARRIEASEVSPSAHLGVLGMPGLTAWVGLTTIAGLRGADRVFVSGAAGAVGSVAGQLARVRGHHVVGSAGSARKVEWLVREARFDAAFDYRSRDPRTALGEAAPAGIDVYFDNVGYDHLEAALHCANDGARFAMCGTVADYDAEEPLAGPSNLFEIVSKRITLRGFIATDHYASFPRFVAETLPLVRTGEIAVTETTVEGLDRAPEALIRMLSGESMGKMLVRLPG